MKTLAAAIILVMVGSAQAATLSATGQAKTIFVGAVSYFTDSATGQAGFVQVSRDTDPTTNVTTTFLVYTFCLQDPDNTPCLEGFGSIPNNAFTGQVTSNVHKADVLNLLADTTIPGFENDFCLAPNEFGGGCDQGTSPATGGIISIAYVKQLGNIDVSTTGVFQEANFQVTTAYLLNGSVSSGSSQGTVIGNNLSIEKTSLGLSTLTGAFGPPPPTGKSTTLGKSHSMLEKLLTPQALLRLQRLTGKKLAE
jgi:hypothetical protein